LTEEKTKQETNVAIAFPSISYPPFFVGLYFNLLTKDALVLGSEIKKSGGKKIFTNLQKSKQDLLDLLWTLAVWITSKSTRFKFLHLQTCIEKITVGGLIIYIGILWLLSGK